MRHIRTRLQGNSATIRELEAAGAQITLCTDARSGNLFEAMRLAIGKLAPA